MRNVRRGGGRKVDPKAITSGRGERDPSMFSVLRKGTDRRILVRTKGEEVSREGRRRKLGHERKKGLFEHGLLS